MGSFEMLCSLVMSLFVWCGCRSVVGLLRRMCVVLSFGSCLFVLISVFDFVLYGVVEDIVIGDF